MEGEGERGDVEGEGRREGDVEGGRREGVWREKEGGGGEKGRREGDVDRERACLGSTRPQVGFLALGQGKKR